MRNAFQTMTEQPNLNPLNNGSVAEAFPTRLVNATSTIWAKHGETGLVSKKDPLHRLITNLKWGEVGWGGVHEPPTAPYVTCYIT